MANVADLVQKLMEIDRVLEREQFSDPAVRMLVETQRRHLVESIKAAQCGVAPPNQQYYRSQRQPMQTDKPAMHHGFVPQPPPQYPHVVPPRSFGPQPPHGYYQYPQVVPPMNFAAQPQPQQQQYAFVQQPAQPPPAFMTKSTVTIEVLDSDAGRQATVRNSGPSWRAT